MCFSFLLQLNSQLEGRTKAEWREDNKEDLSKYKKKWYEDNKEELSKKRKENYEDHKEEILKKQKENYEKHKVEILEKQREKILCEECGIYYTKSNKTKHLNSKKHMESLNDI